VHEHNLQ
jgi:hypothetical protein